MYNLINKFKLGYAIPHGIHLKFMKSRKLNDKNIKTI